ncbi:MAG: alanine racemase [Bradymonadales bacterium]|jgi:alanine racemase
MYQIPANVGLHRSYLKIDLGALEHNIRVMKSGLAQGSLLGAVVKSNAYGHGIKLCWRAFKRGGADYFCVDSLHEAYELREDSCEDPIFVMGHIPPAHACETLHARVLAMVYDIEQIDALGQAANTRRQLQELMIKIETGTQRQGVSAAQAVGLAKHIKRYPYLKLKGLASHFANIEDSTDHSYANEQIRIFNDAIALFEREGFPTSMNSIANSAATILWPHTHLGLCRAGITCYGMWPSTESYVSAKLLEKVVDLRPALQWEAAIAQVKTVDVGSVVGYGCTYRCTHPTRLAIVPVGYYDGYCRSLSNLGYALVGGQRAPIRGRICMNMCMLDVSDVENVQAGDIAVLLGKQGDEYISAETIASWTRSINYEVTTQIQTSVPRIAS